MFVKQLYTGCLSEAAYFIASEGEAAVVDPMRDIDAYLELAREKKVTIRYIFETHFHADFISGHLDLAAKTGAVIVYGPQTSTNFPVHIAKDGERFNIGRVSVSVIHTPGHTIESSCYLLKDEQDKPYCLFTGDTLFVGDVGRPDLFSGSLSKEVLAGHLYESLAKLKALPDEVIVYPAHGPGSSCGKNLGDTTYSTIGEQKRSNYALLATDKDTFIQEVIEGLTPPPQYFPLNAKINREGYAALDEVLQKGLQPLSVEAFRQKAATAVILDTRDAASFAAHFIPGAVNIGLDGRFAEWVGILVPFNKPVVLVTEPGKEEETVVRMARVGFDNVEGYLEGGMDAWINAGQELDMVINIDADELAMDMPFDQHLIVIDVRKPSEYEHAHIKGALNIPLEEMTDPASLADLEDHHNLYVHCQSGYRSMAACSILKREGIHNLRNITGGFKVLMETPGIPIVNTGSVVEDTQ